MDEQLSNKIDEEINKGIYYSRIPPLSFGALNRNNNPFVYSTYLTDYDEEQQKNIKTPRSTVSTISTESTGSMESIESPRSSPKLQRNNSFDLHYSNHKNNKNNNIIIPKTLDNQSICNKKGNKKSKLIFCCHNLLICWCFISMIIILCLIFIIILILAYQFSKNEIIF